MRHEMTTHDPDMFDVRASLLAAYRVALLEWKVIAITCLVMMVVVTAYVLYWPPVYQAQAVLMSEGDRDTARDSFYGAWSVFRKDDLRTETELFTSAPVLKEVIKREKLTYDDIYHPIGSHIGYLWYKSWPGRAWRGLREWITPPEAGALTPEEQDRARTLADMKAGIAIASVGEANLGTLTVRGPTRRVADVANTVIEVYLEQRLERYRAESMKAVDTLTEEADAAQAALGKIEAERIRFMREHGLGVGIEKEKLEVTKLSDLEERAAESRAKVAAAEASLQEIERQLAAEPATRTVSTSFEINALREATKGRRLELQTALVHTRQRYREDSPEVQEILASIAGLDALIAGTSEKVAKASTDSINVARDELRMRQNNLRTELAGLRASLASMERRRTALRTRMAQIPTLEARLLAFERDHKFAQDKYLTLTGRRTQAAVSLAGLKAMPSIRLISGAVRPDNKVWPRIAILYPVALVASLVLGLALALGKSVLLGRIRREHLLQGRKSAQFYGLVDAPREAPRIAVVLPERLAPGSST